MVNQQNHHLWPYIVNSNNIIFFLFDFGKDLTLIRINIAISIHQDDPWPFLMLLQEANFDFINMIWCVSIL